MLQRLSIRGKILAALAVPVFVLLGAAAYLVLNSIGEVSKSANATQLLSLVENSQTFNAAMRTEGDAATNYVDAWTQNAAKMNRQILQLDTALDDLHALGESDSAAAEAAAEVDTIVRGGQPIAEGVAWSLATVREVRPEPNPEGGFIVWPNLSDVGTVASSYSAMANAIDRYNDTVTPNSATDEALTNVEFLMRQEGLTTQKFLTETPEYQVAFQASLDDVNESWTLLEINVSDVANRPENADLVSTLDEVKAQMTLLTERRDAVMNREVGASPTAKYYFDSTEALSTATSEIALLVDDPDLSRQIEAYVATDKLLDEMAREDTAVDLILRAGDFGLGTATAIRTQFARTDFVREEAVESLEGLEAGLELPDTGASFDQASQSDYETVRNRVGDATGLQLVTAARQDWPTQVKEELAVIVPFIDDTLTMANTTASANQRDAVLGAVATIAVAAIVVFASILVALLIARRIVSPLRRLTTTATAVRQELPRLVERVALPGERVDVSEVQIPVESNDEIGRLAEAFNSVNASTLAIASEQAALRGSISEMFVNVARRDQVLLNRQLSAIDEMERTEDNAGTLTRLFALDHLATRMRRNSESLLVLAGIDTGRRLRRPMPLSDVIRTASSEIELYERVQLELDTDPAMVGHSALTAAHLFAELLENATVFSDPGAPVVVRTETDGNSYIVRVTDTGIGMSPEELADANSRVASSAASEILGAQRLGLFVVGRIARRIGARVEIVSHEGEGTVATVTMPPSLFDSSAEPTDTSRVSGNAMDDEMHAPSALVGHSIRDEVLDTSSSVASAAERAGTSSLGISQYQPAAIETGSSLAERAGVSTGVAALLAADAANAPEGEEVDLAALTDGVSETGLPTRKRSGSGGPEGSRETDSIIALPVRATDAQLSALEADVDSGFTPLVSASEVSPQTAEQRASMFRGFRPRREGDDLEATPPDAESLGQAVRRGAAVLPEDGSLSGLAFTPPAIAFEDDDVPAVADNHAPSTGQSPLISGGFDHVDHEANPASMGVPRLEGSGDNAAAVGPLVIPTFADDDEPAYASEPVAAEYAANGVESVSLDNNEAYTPAVPEPHGESVDYGMPAAAPIVAAGVFAAASSESLTSSPSLDELIQGGAARNPKGGFFSKLFGGKSKAAPVEQSAVTAMLASMPQTPAPMQVPAPMERPAPFVDTAASVEAPAPTGGFAPAPDDGDFGPFSGDVPLASVPEAAAPWISEPSQGAADDFSSLTPPEASTPYNPGAMTGDAHLYSRDELAKPLGWETAGATALQAAAPDQVSGYSPVVQLDAQPVVEEGDMASAAFTELSSLSSQRPKVERTSAGLQKRRSADAVAPVVVPIEDEIEIAHMDRDPDAVRSRFASFYSGTQRARTDVEAFERSTLGTLSET